MALSPYSDFCTSMARGLSPIAIARHAPVFGSSITVSRDRDLAGYWDTWSLHDGFTNERLNCNHEFAGDAMEELCARILPAYEAMRRAGYGPKSVRVLWGSSALGLLNECLARASRRYMQSVTVAPRAMTMRDLQSQFRDVMHDGRMQMTRDHFAALLDAQMTGLGMAPTVTITPEADQKAHETLRRYLTPEQIQDLDSNHAFNVVLTGWKAGTYRISDARSFSVTHIETGDRYCIVPAERVPIADQMLTTKLVLENETEKFFRTANCSRAAARAQPGRSAGAAGGCHPVL